MKTFVIRTAAACVFLVSLTLFVVAGSPIAAAATYHATTPTHSSSTAKQGQNRDVYQANCGSGTFQILANNVAWCYAGSGGYIPLTLPSVTEICSVYAASGSVYFTGGQRIDVPANQCREADSLTAIGLQLN